MNARLFLLPLLLAAGGAALSASAANNAANPLAATPTATRELVITVVEPVGRGSTNSDFYYRIDREFTDAFNARKWPLKIKIDRFAANTPHYPIELRVFPQHIREEVPGEWTFRAWLTLHEGDQKHDFGIVRFDFWPRPRQPMDEVLDRLVRGGAEIAADKVGAILFPSTPAPTKP